MAVPREEGPSWALTSGSMGKPAGGLEPILADTGGERKQANSTQQGLNETKVQTQEPLQTTVHRAVSPQTLGDSQWGFCVEKQNKANRFNPRVPADTDPPQPPICSQKPSRRRGSWQSYGLRSEVGSLTSGSTPPQLQTSNEGDDPTGPKSLKQDAEVNAKTTQRITIALGSEDVEQRPQQPSDIINHLLLKPFFKSHPQAAWAELSPVMMRILNSAGYS
ncbi:unnamed protein product, partial [Pleuronectes platessa]